MHGMSLDAAIATRPHSVTHMCDNMLQATCAQVLCPFFSIITDPSRYQAPERYQDRGTRPLIGIQHGGEALDGLPVAGLLQRHVERHLRHRQTQAVQALCLARYLQA